MDPAMKSWIGSTREQLIQGLGQPSEEIKLSSGGGRLVYVTPWGEPYGSWTCRRVFDTDEKNVVRSWSRSGCYHF